MCRAAAASAIGDIHSRQSHRRRFLTQCRCPCSGSSVLTYAAERCCAMNYLTHADMLSCSSSPHGRTRALPLRRPMRDSLRATRSLSVSVRPPHTWAWVARDRRRMAEVWEGWRSGYDTCIGWLYTFTCAERHMRGFSDDGSRCAVVELCMQLHRQLHGES